MLSALTLLCADENERDKWSYVVLAEELRRISSQPKVDAQELFRRMVFNALISNDDDHPRNHAVIAMNHEWKLSPAYDLTPSTPVSTGHRDLALSCGDHGRAAKAESLLTQCERFHLSPEQAGGITDQMKQIVKTRWYDIAGSESLSDPDCERSQTAFVYAGFRV